MPSNQLLITPPHTQAGQEDKKSLVFETCVISSWFSSNNRVTPSGSWRSDTFVPAAAHASTRSWQVLPGTDSVQTWQISNPYRVTFEGIFVPDGCFWIQFLSKMSPCRLKICRLSTSTKTTTASVFLTDMGSSLGRQRLATTSNDNISHSRPHISNNFVGASIRIL